MDKKIELQQIDMDFLSEMLLKIKVKRSGKELSASDISNLTAEALMEYELYFGVEKISKYIQNFRKLSICLLLQAQWKKLFLLVTKPVTK